MPSNKYNDIIFEIKGKIGIIKFNRPKSLNAFGGNLLGETINALRELNQNPDTVFTVLTGAGRFFSAGADVKAEALKKEVVYANDAEKKLAYMARFSTAIELLRSMIDHRKVLVLALNGPAVGGGAAWFPGICDIVLATDSSYLQVPFSALGLVPENGSALSFAQSIGVHRANDFLMFGRKISAAEAEAWGVVNYIFCEGEGSGGFMAQVIGFLEEQLRVNDGKSMMEMKRLQNAPLRDGRMVAVYNAADALAERFVDGAPLKRFKEKRELLESKSKSRTSKI
ncbi:peroxisomal d3,d2-enoyl-CoA isomeras-like protein [Lepidopterella palustris CBS 459.81]|uniref:Peroxisomal d3,d2-enoyl-CoA isomeras-like protein n=1 Tax=Lepidopterella palustris CBS 459.81 TaxID=1314670 RepID=A0A8E2JH11_9PEZI|nr:peroxisomal d3,d2-enoyl-CoA isomeras-like protein [Lepidopterella palustris CBS 459.81]